MSLRHGCLKLCLNAALAAAMLVASAQVPIWAQSQPQWDSLYDRIIQLEEAVHDIQRQGPARPYGQLPDNRTLNPQSMAQFELRIGNLEEQVRQLLATIESMNHELRSLNQQVTRNHAGATGNLAPTTVTPLQNDAGETRHTGGLPVYDPSALESLIDGELVFEAGSVTGNSGNSDIDLSLNRDLPPSGGSYSQPNGPMNLGTITLNRSGQVSGASIGASPPGLSSVEKLTLDGEQVASLTPGSGPELVYEQAYENLLQRRFGAAEAGFELFLARNKKHKLAVRAQYWLGETHYARKDYTAAARAFLAGYKQNKKSSIAPQSLLKLAMSLHKLNQKSSACATFAQVKSEFPKAKSLQKLAGKEARRAGC